MASPLFMLLFALFLFFIALVTGCVGPAPIIIDLPWEAYCFFEGFEAPSFRVGIALLVC